MDQSSPRPIGLPPCKPPFEHHPRRVGEGITKYNRKIKRCAPNTSSATIPVNLSYDHPPKIWKKLVMLTKVNPLKFPR
uniref:Uncharacterized protein n=1 Tax=Meloidogyne floridensis TaxID=298350 RepID=A0A915NBU3_9BILA